MLAFELPEVEAGLLALELPEVEAGLLAPELVEDVGGVEAAGFVFFGRRIFLAFSAMVWMSSATPSTPICRARYITPKRAKGT